MSFVDPAQMPMLGLGRRFNPVSDFSKTAFVNEDMALYDLFGHHLRTNRAIIDGITFTGCRIEGPAIGLILDGTRFDTTNFGESKGDIANLVLRPTGAMAIGTIPLRNCTFIGCEFYMLGFTGNESVIQDLLMIGKEA